MNSDIKSGKAAANAGKSVSSEVRKLGTPKKELLTDRTMSSLERVRLAVLFVVLAGLAFYAWRSHQWHSEVRAINALIKNEDVNTALEQVRALERKWGRSGESSFLRGRAHRYLAQVDLSLKALNEARVLGYSPERIDHEQVLLEVQHVDMEINEQVAKEVISSYQADIEENATALVRGLLRTNDPQGAHLIITIWNNEQPDEPRLKYLTGLTAEKIGEYTKSKEAFEQSYDANPDYLPIWLELAKIYWRENNVQEAYKLFDEYFQKRPESIEAEGGRVETLLALGEYQRVVDYFKSYSQSLDTSGRGRIFLGQAYEGLEMYPEVIATVLPLSKDWPNDILANQLLAVAYKEGGNTAESEKYAEQARLGVGEQSKVSFLRTQLADEFQNPKLHQELGSILLKYVSRVEGVAELLLTLKLDPENKIAHQDLAYFYEVTGEADLAAQHRNASGTGQ